MERSAGVHGRSDNSVIGGVLDGVEAVGLGILAAAGMWLLRIITLDTPLVAAVGRIALESLPFALGAALADRFTDQDRNQSSEQATSRPISETLSDVGATVVGAVIVAVSIDRTGDHPGPTGDHRRISGADGHMSSDKDRADPTGGDSSTPSGKRTGNGSQRSAPLLSTTERSVFAVGVFVIVALVAILALDAVQDNVTLRVRC